MAVAVGGTLVAVGNGRVADGEARVGVAGALVAVGDATRRVAVPLLFVAVDEAVGLLVTASVAVSMTSVAVGGGGASRIWATVLVGAAVGHTASTGIASVGARAGAAGANNNTIHEPSPQTLNTPRDNTPMINH